ncbi:condensin-2 complex subunit H2 [Corythoichthys intestinalis]|uniref:condensin-2 complex subunit H2 n=1 Tax=Corythoichthys intestinalis TaxID=161448 RepID=UPI0025A572D2|nr:condensin-2 complex subunit H2 [Corythoichthys intestinalis]XP_057678915.1 condensin-2 complex subunit H2 [Corythoichthys intestinalis]
MESTESRFAHLLKPIRELTKNWDMDVAAELNDYLEELDEMCITFDEGKTRLNFAEAALLIQGSTSIYSKKVELLHNLVYQTLDYIRDRNNKRNKEAAAGDGSQVRETAHRDDDDNDDNSFYDVDVKTADCVDRNEDDVFVKVVPLPPTSLIPPESHEKLKFPLISSKGEVPCSQKDFRINIFLPGLDNMIILAPVSQSDMLLQTPVNAPAGGRDVTAESPEHSFLPLDDVVEADPGVDEHIQRQQASGRERPERVVLEEVAHFADNTWTLHDPYVTLKEGKPFTSGKCYKVPAGLDDGGKRKRLVTPTLKNFRTWFKETYDPPERNLRKGPASIDLNYIYREVLKRKLRNLRRIKRKQFGGVSDGDLIKELLEPQENQGNFEFQEQEHQDSDDEHEMPEEGDDVASPEAEQLTYEDLVKLRVELMTKNCRDYTQETALSRRVQEWEEKIHLRLLEQDGRATFDIHDYGDRIVSALGEVGRRRSFASIVNGVESFQACRLLLASLQLANDNTVAVDSAAGTEAAVVDTAGLTLLSKVRAADRFKNLPALPQDCE